MELRKSLKMDSGFSVSIKYFSSKWTTSDKQFNMKPSQTLLKIDKFPDAYCVGIMDMILYVFLSESKKN